MKFIIKKSNKKIADFIESKVRKSEHYHYGKTKKNSNFIISLQDDNKKIIGGIAGYIYREKFLKPNWIGVDENYRGQGLGMKLMLKLEEFAKSKNCKVIQLCSYDSSKEFYIKLGFTLAGTLSKWIDESDLHFFRKEI